MPFTLLPDGVYALAPRACFAIFEARNGPPLAPALACSATLVPPKGVLTSAALSGPVWLRRLGDCWEPAALSITSGTYSKLAGLGDMAASWRFSLPADFLRACPSCLELPRDGVL